MEEGSERGQEDRGKDLGEVEEESRETNQEPNAVRRRSLTQKGMSHKAPSLQPAFSESDYPDKNQNGIPDRSGIALGPSVNVAEGLTSERTRRRTSWVLALVGSLAGCENPGKLLRSF